MKIINNILEGDAINYAESPNQGGEFKPGNLDTIIIHFTAGASRESSVRSLSKEKYKVSAHLVLGRDGKTTQLMPFTTIAWHAGESKYGDRTNFNNYAIGIEIDNAGRLEKEDGKYVSWFGRIYPENEVFSGVHRNETESTYWHSYTDEQIKTCKAICELLCNEYDIKHILGHEEISPGRKIDPGPAFPLDEFRNELLK